MRTISADRMRCLALAALATACTFDGDARGPKQHAHVASDARDATPSVESEGHAASASDAHAAGPVAAKPAGDVDPRPRQPGLWARFYFVGEPMESLPVLVPNQTPNVSVVL